MKDNSATAAAVPIDPDRLFAVSQIALIERDTRARITEIVQRSSRIEVRNPITALPNFDKLADLSPEARAALVAILGDIALDARERAEKCWRTHKAPMAAYWKACSVYAGHIKRAVAKATAPLEATEEQGSRSEEPISSRLAEIEG